MLKEIIKPGMVVEFRNGVRAFVVKIEDYTHIEKIMFIDPNGFEELDSYNENLVISHPKVDLKKLDIMKIYDTKHKYGLGINGLLSDECTKEFKLLWQREETIEISLEDISKKFNIPVSQIRIKDKYPKNNG